MSDTSRPLPPPKFEATDATAKPQASAAERYRPQRERAGTALCLSGGGFRATLFHLGALRRLNEAGVLAKLDTITSVSGGSIMAAALATRAPWAAAATGPIPTDVWERDVAAPVRRFASRNLRTRAMLHRLLHPFNSSAGVRGLIAGYAARLTPAKLTALPERPRFVFCATDLCYGVNFVFERGRVGDYRLGYVSPPPDDWTVARAVAASSCFPPIFNPLPLDVAVEGFKRGRKRLGDADVRLSDGGLYDNLGLEPVWKDHRTVMVSDGGAVFSSASDKGLLARISRYVDVVDYQALALRKRWLLSNFLDGTMSGAYWGIGSATGSYEADGAGYSKDLATEVIAAVRTDLDAFSTAEMAVLENHGYALAGAAIATHLPHLAGPDAPAAAPPHPDWLDEDRVRAALASSWKRKLLGRWRS
jgi:NTE family protein